MCPLGGRALLERYVEERLDHAAAAAHEADRVAVAGPGRAPDDRPRLVPLERVDGGPGIRAWQSWPQPSCSPDARDPAVLNPLSAAATGSSGEVSRAW